MASAPQILLDKELAVFIDAQAFTDDAGVQAVVYSAMEQPTPDFTITVVLESGPAPQRLAGEINSFVVRVRHRSAEEAAQQMRAVFKLLHEFAGRAGALPIGRITASAGAIPLGRDDQRSTGQGRWIVQQTFTATTEQF